MRTRGFGRRKSDKVKLGVGIVLGLLIAGVVLSKVGCDGTSTEPTPVASPTAPAQVGAGSSLGPPTVVQPGTEPGGFDVAFSDGACFTVKNNGGAAAALESWYSGLDDQNAVIDKKPHAIAAGATASRCFNKGCIQVDVDQPGVRLVAGGFFDKDQKPFIPSRNPEKVNACRTTPCVEKWTADEGYETIYGEWGSCQAPTHTVLEANSVTQTQCQRKRSVTKVYYERSSCTRERRELRRTTDWGYEPCACPTPPPQSGYCYYEVDCGNQSSSNFTASTSCPSSTKKTLCEQKGGSWSKWISQSKEHCRIALPGVSIGNFQLTPGQSHKDCLSKHDDD